MSPDVLACHALLNCLIREVSAPEDQAWEDDGHLVIRLARSAVVLRAKLRRPSAGIGPRPAGEVQVRQEASWQEIGWRRLAELIAAELTLATGTPNTEFATQVSDGHAAFGAILRERAERDGTGPARDRVEAYLASEQALVAGHRFHPSPKTRPGQDWLRYAPEAGARFPLRFLAVRADVLAGDGDSSGLDRLGGPVPPDGYLVLPAHPWQLRLLAGQPGQREILSQALRRGLLADLGDGGREVVPTSSVRTVYDPVADVFCKFSLNVRITNCVRKSAWYELAGSVALTRLLAPVFAELGRRFPGTVLLGEPGYRTVALASRDSYEGLAVIVRDGVRVRTEPHVTPLLAASLTEPAARLFDGRDCDWLIAWWQAYVRMVAPPVLGAFFGHGVVLEPHLQNVLVGVDDDGWPAQVLFRDLEGTKLVSSRHATLLAGLPAGVARGLAYDARRGWDRVAYCLLVNHLAEIAAAIADRSPAAAACERELWRQARHVLTEAAGHGVTDPEFNLGGGMAVDYARPDATFDWSGYGRGLADLARPGETLRIEPGRAVTAYCGWYLTRVLDVKHSHGEAFAVIAGGTHHLRTPAAKGHDQPFAVIGVEDWAPSRPRPGVTGQAVTIAGQLCTPKDVLARRVRVSRLRAGDLVAFGLAGAYAWNISHHGFLMHPPPSFHYLA